MTSEEIDKFVNDNFIDLKLEKNGYSMFAIRESLLNAAKELQTRISGDVIDLGCGDMPYKKLLMSSGKITSYKGVDIKSDIYNKIPPDYFWDGQTIPLNDNSADWVIATEFFEHYFDTQSILKEIKRVLRPGGKIFFTVPFVWNYHETPYDEYRFTKYSLEKHFLKADFSNIEIKALGDIHRSLAIMLGLWDLNYPIFKGQSFKRKLFRKVFAWFYRYLLKMDNKENVTFKNDDYPSGLYGFITK
jgi:SAM-dependent methyltransferase